MSGFGARREHRVIAEQLSLTVKITKGYDLAGTKRTKSLNSPLDEVSPLLFIPDGNQQLFSLTRSSRRRLAASFSSNE